MLTLRAHPDAAHDLLDRDAEGLRHLAAELVDDILKLLRNRGGTVHNYRESGQAPFDFFQNIKAELRLGARLELIRAVRCAYGYCQGIAACAGDEFLHVLGAGVGGILAFYLYLVLDAGESAKLGLNHHAVVMGILDNLFRYGDIFVQRLGGSVDHNRGEASVYAVTAEFVTVAVIQMQADGKARFNNGSLHELYEISVVGIGSGAL